MDSLELLEGAAGACLDRVVALAAFAFDVPVAFVVVVDQAMPHVIASSGATVAELDHRHAPWVQDGALENLTVVSDLAADPRFAGHPLVTGPRQLQFHACAPLVGADGIALGALCLMDTRPRTLDAGAREHLQTCARLAMNQLELRRLAGRVDPVSGLPNRQQFHADFEAVCARLHADATYVVMLDVLDVARANEAGQALGMSPLDAMIRRSGVRLRVALDGIAVPYHVGASRFAFLLERPSREHLEALLEELRVRVSRPIIAAAVPMSPQFHAGAYAVDRGNDRSDDALRKALIGLQAAIAGRCSVCWYSAKRDQRLRRGYRLAADAERGLRREEFHLLFQPRLRTATQQPVSAEALIRWDHPRLGPLSPGEFIPVFERTALMPKVTDWVTDTALHHLQVWQARGIPLALSINLAASDLSSESAAAALLAKAARYGVAPQHLEVEITEGEWLRPYTVSAAQLRLLADAGVKIAIDDFGSGYSNFGYLAELPVSTIKLDKTLIDSLAHQGPAYLKVKAITELARGLGYTTVAEGVERQDQLEVLAALGCDEVQGYLFSGAINADDLQHFWLRAQPVLPTPGATR